MAKYPPAIWKQFPGIGPYRTGPLKIVHHTTEGGSAAGAISTYQKTGSYPHFTVEGDIVYQHVDTDVAVTALEHPAGTSETNRSHAVQIELVGFAGRAKSRTSLETMRDLCRWLERQHNIPRVWPNGFPNPPVNGRDPGHHNRDESNWNTKGGHYGHCHVPNNHHWDPAYSAEEVTLVMDNAPSTQPIAVDLALEVEAFEPMLDVEESVATLSTPTISPYVQALLEVVNDEYESYHRVSETDEPLRSRIDLYCSDIGLVPPPDISAFPWSATFVSWCIKQAGATRDEFRVDSSHAVFVKAAIANSDRGVGVFRARPIEDYAPRVGDLIHRNRSGGTITYMEARGRSDYPSHSTIVVEIGEDQGGRFAETIGGNESDSIRRTRVALRSDGKVEQKPANPFICVVQDAKLDGAPAGQVVTLMMAEADPSSDLRFKMAQVIVNFEARRDNQKRLMVYNLPIGDGGGRYEVAGINERFNKRVCDELVQLIRDGKQGEAERRAVQFIASNTDVAAGWTSNPGVEFYLRDCVFNRGTRGAAWILQKAVGVPTDQSVGEQTLAAVTRAEAVPLDLLAELRKAREAYERLHRDETSIFWIGLVNRWNHALVAAKSFLPSDTAHALQAPAANAPHPMPNVAIEQPPEPVTASLSPLRLEAEAVLTSIPGVQSVGEGRNKTGDPAWIAYVRDGSAASKLPAFLAYRPVVAEPSAKIGNGLNGGSPT